MFIVAVIVTFLIYITVTGFIIMREEYKDKPLTSKDSWMTDGDD